MKPYYPSSVSRPLWLPLSLAAFFIAFAPSYDTLSFINERYDDKRFSELTILGSLLCVLILSSRLRASLHWVWQRLSLPVRIGILLIALLALLSAGLAPLPRYGFLELGVYSGLFILTLCIAAIGNIRFDRLSIGWISLLIISAAIYQITFYTSYLGSLIEGNPLDFPEPFSGFSNVRFFNQYQTYSLVLLPLPALLFPSLKKAARNGLLILGVLWLIMLLVSKSRGALLAYLVSLALTLAVFRKPALSFVKFNAGLFGTALIGFWLLFFIVPAFMEIEPYGWRTAQEMTSAEESARIVLWRSAITLFLSSPLLGVGPMHYAAYPQIEQLGHPHNSIFQWLAEMGLPSTILLITLIGRGLFLWAAQTQQLADKGECVLLRIAMFCTIVTVLLYSMVCGVIVMPLSQTLLAITAGWMMGAYLRAHDIETNIPIQAVGLLPSTAWQISSGILLIVVTYTVLPDVLPRITGQEMILDNYYQPHGPRFWQQGGIPQ